MTNRERAKAVLSDLDTIARDIDHYEYGLPIYSDDDLARLEPVVTAVLGAVEAEALAWAAGVALSVRAVPKTANNGFFRERAEIARRIRAGRPTEGR